MHKNILIAYFTWSGNTKYVAEKIKNAVGGDLLQIETKMTYPKDYHEAAYVVAKRQHEENEMPELKDNGDVSKYDVVFVGTPAWWYEMAPAVKTFLNENNFEGKTIVPFITHGGGGKYSIKEDMAKFSNASKVLKPFVVANRGSANIQKEIEDWIEELKNEL